MHFFARPQRCQQGYLRPLFQCLNISPHYPCYRTEPTPPVEVEAPVQAPKEGTTDEVKEDKAQETVKEETVAAAGVEEAKPAEAGALVGAAVETKKEEDGKGGRYEPSFQEDNFECVTDEAWANLT